MSTRFAPRRKGRSSGRLRAAFVCSLLAGAMACESEAGRPSPAPVPPPDSGAAVAEVRTREEELRLAMLASDTAALGGLLAAEYLSTSAVGHTSTRAETILAYGARLVRVDSAAIRDLDLRVYGSAVVALGYLDWSGEAAGQPFHATARFQRVWAREADGRWMLVANQLTGQAPGAGRQGTAGRP